MRKYEKNSSTDSKTREGGAGGSPGFGSEIPLQPIVKTMVKQVVYLQPVEVHGVADICTPICDETYASTGRHVLKESAAQGELTQKQALGRSCGHGDKPTQE